MLMRAAHTTSAPRQRGGVALLVRNRFRVRDAFAWSGPDSQFVSAWVDGWLLASVYTCPSQDDAPVFDLLEVLIPWMSQVPLTQPWLFVGDFNELVDTSKLKDGLDAFGGVAVSVDRPTRWEGNRCVDWALTNRPRLCHTPELVDIHLSDHIPVSLVVDGLGHALCLGSLKCTASLHCPTGVDRALWERAVSDQWTGNPEVARFVHFLHHSVVSDVQGEWDRFQALLTACVLDAYAWLAGVGFLPPDVRAECERLARQSSFKGQCAVYSSKSCAHAGVRHLVGDLAVRKQRRLLARSFCFCAKIRRICLQCSPMSWLP